MSNNVYSYEICILIAFFSRHMK